jgi:prolyl oligopeptidase
VNAAISTTGNELYIKDLTNPKGTFVTVVDNFETVQDIIDNDGTKLYIATNLNAPNVRVVTVDAKNPTPENWVDFIPETENVLSPATGAGYFFANYMIDAISKVNLFAKLNYPE